MWRFIRIGIVFSIGLILSTPAQAQLLQRLESKVREALNDVESAPADDPENSIEPRRGYLGLTVSSDEGGEEIGDEGLKVIAVDEGSPAAKAGFQSDDLITGIAGRSVRAVADMEDALLHAAESRRLRFDILRDGDPLQLTVQLDEPLSILPAPKLKIAQRPSLGITVAPVTEEARRRDNLPIRKGALISAVKKGGAAHRAGLPVGGVVVAFDGQRIDSPQELINAVRESDVGQEVELQYFQGATLQRKKVRLAPELEPLAPNLDNNRSSNPTGRIRDLLGTDLPAVKKLEGLLDRNLTPGRLTPERAIANENELAELRQQVEILKQQVSELTQKLEELTKSK